MERADILDAKRAISDNSPLSPSQIEALTSSFVNDGYFVIPNVVSADRLKELHERLSDQFNKAKQSGSLFSGGGLVSGHLNCFPGSESQFVYDTLQERGIIDLIRSLHPNATRMPNIGCNFNLPGSATQHYHTDREFTRDFMIANVAVVDTVEENGAIELIPGTHKRFYRFSRFVLERPQRNSIRVPMKRGDVLVRTSNLWHRGMPNRTSSPRPMMAMTWEDGGSKKEDSFAVEDGSIRFFPNWFRPTRIGRIRERIFVTVPATYTASRFIRSLYDKNY